MSGGGWSPPLWAWAALGALVGAFMTLWGLLPVWFARLAERKGRVLLPDVPHPVASEAPWPGCWCGEPEDDPVHQGAGGAR